MGKKFSLDLKALIFLCLVSTSLPQFNWQDSKRKHGGGKIKQMGKIHVHHNFWRHKYYFQSVWQTVLVKRIPAQKARTGYTAGLQQHSEVARLKEMPTGSGTPDSNAVAVWGQHGPDAQSDSGAPRQPCGPRLAWTEGSCTALGPKLRCTHWHYPNCSTSLQTSLHPLQKNLGVESGKGRMLWINKILVWTGREAHTIILHGWDLLHATVLQPRPSQPVHFTEHPNFGVKMGQLKLAPTLISSSNFPVHSWGDDLHAYTSLNVHHPQNHKCSVCWGRAGGLLQTY